MDLIEELDLNDSGMESLTASKDETPERNAETRMECTPDVCPGMVGKEYDMEPDESWSERLWGLTEMFPECLRNSTHKFLVNAVEGLKTFYGLSRNVCWIVASSSVILFAPIIFECERAQMEEIQKSQQKQVLLGTNAPLSGPTPSILPLPR